MKLSDFNLLNEKKDKGSLDMLIHGFNRTNVEYPQDKTAHRIFVEQALRRPNAIAVKHGNKQITYSELDKRSNQLARFLIDMKLEQESFAGIILDRSVDMIISILGIMKAGGTYFPINHELPFDRIKYMLLDTKAGILISHKRLIRMLNKLQWECPHLKAFLCTDSLDVHGDTEDTGELMNTELWDFFGREAFDDISCAGWKSSYTGEWLSREVMDGYGENISKKLTPYINKNSRVLEIGCSSGISLFRMAPKVGFYLGIDLSKEILSWTEKEVKKRGLNNIRLKRLAAHEIDCLDEKGFDIVILNSLVQCFNGHNYLRKVIRKAIDLMYDEGLFFFGNIWDHDLKDQFVQSLIAFKRERIGDIYKTKTDRSEELFISRAFFDDLCHDYPEITNIDYSRMIGTTQSELSEYGYDVIIQINKNNEAGNLRDKVRNKYQFDKRKLDAYSDALLEERICPNGLAYLIYTSGTTGNPKGVMIEHKSLVNLSLDAVRSFNIKGTDRLLQFAMPSFDPSVYEIFMTFAAGAELVLVSKETISNTQKFKGYLEEHKVTVINLPPQYLSMIDLNNLKDLRMIITGGEPPNVSETLRYSQTKQYINAYGPTEICVCATHHLVKPDGNYQAGIPIGKPISNMQCYILDNQNKPKPVSIVGELCISGDGLARGYLNDHDLTVKKFVPHPFLPGKIMYRTGDRGKWLSNGEILFMGRMDSQVKIRGFRIEPGEIENHLRSISEINDVLVIDREDREGLKYLCAYVVVKKNISVHVLRDELSHTLPDYMIPSFFVFLDKIPLTIHGKVDRKSLPDPEETRQVSEDHEPPKTETEKQLALIWEEVLSRKNIGTTDNFFNLGGHSLKVTKMVSLIQKQMGVEVPLAIVFKASTIRELASYVSDVSCFERNGINVKSLMNETMFPLSKQDGKKGKNIFAFPPGSGYCVPYAPLAELLQPYSFYGFNFIETDNFLMEYADIVTGVDSTGPYTFFGWSAGGNLAFQVARELEKRDKSVNAIVMLDSARYMEKLQFSEEEVKKNAEEILKNVTSIILKEKILRKMKSYYTYIKNCVEYGILDSDIHILLEENGKNVHYDSSGRVLASIEGWRETTRGTFKTYQGYGIHLDMLKPNQLEKNAILLKGIFGRIFNT